jgi:hypothetical protein
MSCARGDGTEKHPAVGPAAAGFLLPLSGDTVRADEGNRTPNLLITNQLLCQLSYVSLKQVKKDGPASLTETDPHHKE